MRMCAHACAPLCACLNVYVLNYLYRVCVIIKSWLFSNLSLVLTVIKLYV